MLVSVTARTIPLLVDWIVVVFLTMSAGLDQIVPALSALLVLLLTHVLSTVLRPPPLVLDTLSMPVLYLENFVSTFA